MDAEHGCWQESSDIELDGCDVGSPLTPSRHTLHDMGGGNLVSALQDEQTEEGDSPSVPPKTTYQSKMPRMSISSLFYYAIWVAYLSYLVAAAVINLQRAYPLLLFTLVVLLWKTTCTILHLMPQMHICLKKLYAKMQRWILGCAALAVLAASGVVIVLTSITSPHRLLALLGLLVFHIVGLLLSTNWRAVKWNPVLCGLILQFALGLFILRTNVGIAVFDIFGTAINRCLDYSDVGSAFVFGPNFVDHFIAFKILPSIIFFSSLVSILYYFGCMQLLIRGCAAIMSETIGISPCETIVAAANIFLGMSTAPLLVKPLLPEMTSSEIHSIMATGFATIAGSMIAVYGAMNVPSNHLVAASVMSAPAALSMSKLICPEEQTPTPLKGWNMVCTEKNVLEAITKGAMESLPLASSVAVMLITFVGLIAMFNAILSWFGSLVDYPELSFDVICSFLFLPFALVMGVEWKDSFKVASMLGTKAIVNEFVAYNQLSQFIQNGTLSEYSIVITSYSLCGFSNLGSIGVMIAFFAMLVPERLAEISVLAPRAMVAGTLACFTTACVAGLLYDTALPVGSPHQT